MDYLQLWLVVDYVWHGSSTSYLLFYDCEVLEVPYI